MDQSYFCRSANAVRQLAPWVLGFSALVGATVGGGNGAGQSMVDYIIHNPHQTDFLEFTARTWTVIVRGTLSGAAEGLAESLKVGSFSLLSTSAITAAVERWTGEELIPTLQPKSHHDASTPGRSTL